MFFKGALSGLTQVFATENSLKIMKNGFCFTLKAFFVLKIFKFLSCLFGHLVKQLYWKINNCTCTSKHILPNISRNKGKQTMKFGQ